MLYHLVYAGRGSNMVKNDLSHAQTREFMDYLMKKAKEFNDKEIGHKILDRSVTAHANGATVLTSSLKNKTKRKQKKPYASLEPNGGNSFRRRGHSMRWTSTALFTLINSGDIILSETSRNRKFSEIWRDDTETSTQRTQAKSKKSQT